REGVVERAQRRDEVEPLLPRRRVARVVQVDEREVEVALLDRGEHFGGRARCDRLVVLCFQKEAEGFENVRLVIGDEDAGGHLFVRYSSTIQPSLSWMTRSP